ncbi:translation elongation factor 4 [Blattabacterium cuenoti]|uniref:translation elongation factor 4 n=1 Tax=Blattabacterium cuenoti TaxID=1653831 RepID=UPI00163C0234|nr:translation elongation factor 4 [Blattabacterium cuenoti]
MHYIRNFCIIAHIDHGKSTLADRFLELTNTIVKKNKDQLLDDMDLERERGITIKSHAVQMNYQYKRKNYILNLIDTPGHVDFSYEVRRSIYSCEGALLVVDCTKGIQAQTVSNLSLALKNNLTIIPVLNKIDLSEKFFYKKIIEDIIDLTKCKTDEIITVSAKTGLGVKNILNRIIEKIPYPTGNSKNPLQAIIFDSIYNPFKGIEIFFRIKNGIIKKGQKLKLMSTGKFFYAHEIGNLKLKYIPKNKISTGDVGYIISGIKKNFGLKVGDTITDFDCPAKNFIQKIEEIKPMVFASIYPLNTDKYEDLRNSMEKLKLNDPSIYFIPESSPALGYGFRCGFLGMLHIEIIKDRLEREYGVSVIITVPNVSYKVYIKNDIIFINNPSNFSDSIKYKKIEEPYVTISIFTKKEFIGNIISLCTKKRGIMINQYYLSSGKVRIIFELPLSEIIFDFYNKLKTISKGYATFDYRFIGYRLVELKKIIILINYEKIESLSMLVHKENINFFAKKICKRLLNIIPRHQFDIAIQASVSGKIIARETIKSFRKDVIGKCYGGDITRKKKLLNKQKKGKKKMRTLGKVEIPSSAFMTFVKIEE